MGSANALLQFISPCVDAWTVSWFLTLLDGFVVCKLADEQLVDGFMCVFFSVQTVVSSANTIDIDRGYPGE